MTVTETAIDHFHKSMRTLAPNPETEKCIRLKPGRRTGLVLAFERPAPTDETFRRDNRVIFAIPRRISEICADKTLDMDEDGKLTLQ